MNSEKKIIVCIVGPLRAGKTCTLQCVKSSIDSNSTYLKAYRDNIELVLEDRAVLNRILTTDKNNRQANMRKYYYEFDQKIINSKKKLIFTDQPLFASKIYDLTIEQDDLFVYDKLKNYSLLFKNLNKENITIALFLISINPQDIYNRLNNLEKKHFGIQNIITLNKNFQTYAAVMHNMGFAEVYEKITTNPLSSPEENACTLIQMLENIS